MSFKPLGSLSPTETTVPHGFFGESPGFESPKEALLGPPASPETVVNLAEYHIPEGYKPNNFRFESESIAGLARPGYGFSDFKLPLAFLMANDIKVIISLSDATAHTIYDRLIRSTWQRNGADHEFHHICLDDPLTDYHLEGAAAEPPTEEQVLAFKSLVEKAAEAGKKIAVYCGLGIHRTGYMIQQVKVGK